MDVPLSLPGYIRNPEETLHVAETDEEREESDGNSGERGAIRETQDSDRMKCDVVADLGSSPAASGSESGLQASAPFAPGGILCRFIMR